MHQDFHIPSSFLLTINDPTVNKKIPYLIQRLGIISASLMSNPEFLTCEERTFATLYHLIRQEPKSPDIAQQLCDLFTHQVPRIEAGQLTKQSEKLIMFLNLFYMSKNWGISLFQLNKLFRNLIKYMRVSRFKEFYPLLFPVITQHIDNNLSHSLIALLLNESSSFVQSMVQTFSAPNMDIVKLMRRLSRQRLEDEDSDTHQKFKELMRPNPEFVEAVIQEYVKGVNVLYSKINRNTLLDLCKYLPHTIAKQSIFGHILEYYDKVSYFIRNTATLVIGELIKKRCFEQEKEDMLIEHLVERCDDVHVHSRTCVLHLLRELIRTRTIKVRYEVMEVAVRRLSDKSSFGRRASVQLLHDMIVCYQKDYGQVIFRPREVQMQIAQMNEQKDKLLADCMALDARMSVNPNLQHELNEIERKLNTQKLLETDIIAKKDFQDQLIKALVEIQKLVMSRSSNECVSSLRTIQLLVRFQWEGALEMMKTPLILIFSKEVRQEVATIYHEDFMTKPGRLVTLVSQCDMLELVSLEELVKALKEFKLEIDSNITEQAWTDFMNGHNVISNLRIVRLITIMELKKVVDKLEQLLRFIKDDISLEFLVEVIQIVNQIPHDETALIFVKEIQTILIEREADSQWWYIACEWLIRVMTRFEKVEIMLEGFVNSMVGMPKILYASATACLKMFVSADKIIKSYLKDVMADELDDETKMYFKVKTEELLQVFERYGTGEHARLAAEICQSIVNEATRERNILIDSIAVLSLLQFMVISKTCTKDNIQIIYQILESQYVQSSIKCNVLISLSDIYYRHPQLIDIQYIFKRMDDKNIKVRRTTIIIISHLMLMGLLKPDVAYIAKHINDSDHRIRAHAKIFFHEFYHKDPQQTFYVLPQLITQMAQDYQVTNEDIKAFAQEVIPMVDKDKIAEQLLDKFLKRYEIFTREAADRSAIIKDKEQKGQDEVIFYNPAMLTATRECQFLSICVYYLKYTYDNLKTLVLGFQLYRAHLNDAFIFEQFKNLYMKCKKQAAMSRVPSRKNQEGNMDYIQLLQQFKANLSLFDTENRPKFQLKKKQGKQKNLQKDEYQELDIPRKVVCIQESEDSVSSLDIEI